MYMVNEHSYGDSLIYNNDNNNDNIIKIIMVTDCEMVNSYLAYKLFCRQSVH